MLPGAFYDELIHSGDSIGNGLSIPEGSNR
jgi:hypothetical protein